MSHVPFVKGFVRPSETDVLEAVGEFPWAGSEEERQRSLPASSVFKQPSFASARGPTCTQSTDSEQYAEYALGQLNDTSLYTQYVMEESSKKQQKTKKNKRARTTRLWKPLPDPINDLDWLATVNETGQTFDSYRSFISMRSGRFKPVHVPSNR
jgi:hypothetical protein